MPLTNFFKSEKDNDNADQSMLQLSAAVILFRLIRSDGQAKMLELVHMSELLRKEFSKLCLNLLAMHKAMILMFYSKS